MENRKYARHGMKDTPTHQSWRALRGRCKSKSGKDFIYYASKGISYDPRWEVFLDFLEDMGERPEGCTLDRLDNSKGYFKNNCRWATHKQQAFNRSSWSKTGIKYIQKYKYGYRVKITGYICQRVKSLEEAIELKEKHLRLKEINYGTSSGI